MRKFAIATLVVSVVGTAVIGLAAPAVAMTGDSGDGRATTTLDTLGFTVQLDKVGVVDVIHGD